MTTPAAAALTLAGAVALGAVSPGAAQPLPPPTARVSGTVVDETGGAMRGVFVRLLPEAGSLTAGFVQLQAEPVVDTTTDAGGAFTFEAPLGAHRLRVSAPGFRTVDRPLRVTPDLEPLAVTLALEALRENVDVVDAGDGFGIDPLASLTATMLSEEDLAGLPTDEEDLALYLLLLAGADSSGDLTDDVSGFIIDGFDEGRLPRPDEITGAPATFTLTSGNGELDIAEAAVESFVQADRGFGERASLRLGLRYEATNHSVDYLRLNPTVNVQYRLFDDTIVSAGSQVSFRDFRDYVRLIRNDGSRYQKQLTISAPSFPDPFAGGHVTVDENRTSLYRLDPPTGRRTASIRRSASPSSSPGACGCRCPTA